MADSSGKNKRRWADAKQGLQHGSRGSGRKRQDMGRKDWNRQQHDRRAENEERNAKRQKLDTKDENDAGALPVFSKDEIDAESRRPKHKVAVMIGYSGTGYKGMQINLLEKTIEGDLFAAFVAAGAISKANANDPKKSALVRCARTDKGVHAAGNVISLKLIIEDPDIVSKINSHLSPQIRVWGLQRTVNSFSCYQACDSRWYEYLIPSHAFLPPHPSTYLAKQISGSLIHTGDVEQYNRLQADVANYWSEVEENSIRPITDAVDVSIRDLVLKALYDVDIEDAKPFSSTADLHGATMARDADPLTTGTGHQGASDLGNNNSETLDRAHATNETNSSERSVDAFVDTFSDSSKPNTEPQAGDAAPSEMQQSDSARQMEVSSKTSGSAIAHGATTGHADRISITSDTIEKPPTRKVLVEKAIKSLREAYIVAKRAYRISPDRLEHVASALTAFVGTKNFHNYTIEKTFKDPSSKRHIKSFQLNPTPIVINGTEWLSLKIHGQSFMMHQIRKMVSMVALTVRCGCPVARIIETLGPDIVSIPKAPGLGLLLERPVFDSYNENIASKFSKEKIDFGNYEAELLDFKQREIYERIFREEEQTAAFQVFFNQIDAYKEPQFLYLTSRGLDAVKNISKRRTGGDSKSIPALESDGELNGEERTVTP